MIYFVDFSSDTTGVGTEESPLTYADLVAMPDKAGHTFKARGRYDAGSNNISFSGFELISWDKALYGPWRLKGVQICLPGVTEGGIIIGGQSAGGSVEVNSLNRVVGLPIKTTGCYISAYQITMLPLGSLEQTIILGSTVRAVNRVFFDFTQANSRLAWVDSIFKTPAMDTQGQGASAELSLTNCLGVDGPASTWGTFTDCDASAVSPESWPGFSSEQSEFFLFSDMPTPPSPGYGSPDYVGYETDLFGNPRQYIGATISKVPPSIITQADDVIESSGEDAEFTIVADGVPAPTYQWYKGEDALEDGEKYSGVDTATLTIQSIEESDEGSYHVVVTNGEDPDVTSDSVSLTVMSGIQVSKVSDIMSFGRPVEVDGIGFGNSTDGITIEIGGVEQNVSSCTNKKVVFVLNRSTPIGNVKMNIVNPLEGEVEVNLSINPATLNSTNDIKKSGVMINVRSKTVVISRKMKKYKVKSMHEIYMNKNDKIFTGKNMRYMLPRTLIRSMSDQDLADTIDRIDD